MDPVRSTRHSCTSATATADTSIVHQREDERQRIVDPPAIRCAVFDLRVRPTRGRYGDASMRPYEAIAKAWSGKYASCHSSHSRGLSYTRSLRGLALARLRLTQPSTDSPHRGNTAAPSQDCRGALAQFVFSKGVTRSTDGTFISAERVLYIRYSCTQSSPHLVRCGNMSWSPQERVDSCWQFVGNVCHSNSRRLTKRRRLHARQRTWRRRARRRRHSRRRIARPRIVTPGSKAGEPSRCRGRQVRELALRLHV